jgi:negative regulator of replication initiation
MGLLKEAIDALKSVVLIDAEMKRLSSNVTKIAESLNDIQRRVITLEAREEILIVRAEAAAQNAASSARNNELGDIRERLVKIETYLAMQAKAIEAKIIAGDSRGNPSTCEPNQLPALGKGSEPNILS